MQSESADVAPGGVSSLLRRNPALKPLLLLLFYGMVAIILSAACGFDASNSAYFLLPVAVGLLCLRRLCLAMHLAALACALLIAAALQAAAPLTCDRIDVPWIRGGAEGEVIEVLRSDSMSATLRLRGRVKLRGLPAFECRDLLLRVRCYGAVMPAAAGDIVSVNARLRLPCAPHLPDDFDESAWLGAFRAILLAECRLRDMRIVVRGASMRRMSDSWAAGLETHIRRIFPARSAGLAVALLTGKRGGIEPARRAEFVLSGTAHVLALSGMHVMVIAGALLPLLALIPHRGLQCGLLVAALALFCFVGGMRESTVRAVLMFALWRTLTGLERRPELLNILCITALLFVAIDPAVVVSPGFQLSFAAVAGIALMYGPLRRLAARLLPRAGTVALFLTDSLCLTLAAGLFVNPLIACHFGMASVVSPAANLVVAPLIMLAMLQALPAVVLGLFWPAAAGLWAQTFDLLISVALYLNSCFAALPHAAAFGASAMPVACGFGLISVWLLSSLRVRHALCRMTVCAAACLLTCYLLAASPPRIELIPRRDVCALLHRSIDINGCRHSACLLLDRHLDMGYAFADGALMKYMSYDCDSLHLLTIGPSALAQLRAPLLCGLAPPISGSVLHKRRDMFAAMDSLSARGIALASCDPACRAWTLSDAALDLYLEFDCRSNELLIVMGVLPGAGDETDDILEDRFAARPLKPGRRIRPGRALDAAREDGGNPDTLRLVLPRLTRRLTFADLSPPGDFRLKAR